LIFLIAIPLNALSDNNGIIKVTVLPFHDLRDNTLNSKVAEIIKIRLSSDPMMSLRDYRTTEKIYNMIVPLYMWGYSENTIKRGGMIWSIEPIIKKEIINTSDVDYIIYGKIFGHEGKVYISTYVRYTKEKFITESFNRISSDNRISEILSDIGDEIKSWLRRRYIIHLAEEDLKRWRGGISAYEYTVSKIRSYIREFQDHILLRTLLLEVYLYKKEDFEPEIIRESSTIVNLYTPSNSEGTQYLLSRGIDPFDILSEIYEKQGKLEKAIEVRERALSVFPFNKKRHEERLALDYYIKAKELEVREDRDSARRYLLKAREFAPRKSDLYKKIERELNKIQ